MFKNLLFKFKIRKFVKRNKLYTNTKDLLVSLETLRQLLKKDTDLENDSLAQSNTLERAFSSYLKYEKSEDNLERMFYVNPESPLMQQPEYIPVPEGFCDLR